MKRPFVLYVDDDYGFLNIFTLSFRNVFDIVTAEDGEEALEQLKKYKNKIDIILADYDMPNMNGLEFLKIIKQNYPYIPFILYTGLGSEQVARDAFTSGAFDYYIKDITGFTFKEKLTNSVRQAIEKAQDERTLATQKDEIRLFKEMAESASYGIITVGPDNEILYFNKTFAEMFRYQPDEITPEIIPGLCNKNFPEKVLDDEKTKPGTKICEKIGIRKDGSTFPVLLTSSKLYDVNGEASGSTHTIIDISSKMEAESRIEHLNKVLLAIRNVNQLIVQEKDRAQLINKACYYLTESRGYDAAWIEITDEQGNVAIGDFSGNITGYDRLTERINSNQKPECLVLADKKPLDVIILDPTILCYDCSLLSTLSSGKRMVTALAHGGKIYGYLGVMIPEDIDTDETEISLFKEVAGDIAYAFYNLEIEDKKALAEQEVKLSEKRYKELFLQMLNGFALHEIITDENGKPTDYRFLEINPAFESITGLKSEATLGKTVKEVIPGIEDIWIERYGKVALTGEPIQFEDYFEPFGKYYRILAYSPLKNYFAVMFNDITKTKKAEIELAKKADLLQRVFDTSPIGINLVDRYGRINYANSEVQKITEVNYETSTKRQYNASEWVITDMNGVKIPDEQLPFFIIRETLQPVYNRLLCIHTPDGQQRFINVNGAPLFSAENEFDGAVILINNITKQENDGRLLKERNSQLSAIFRAIPDLFLNIDINGKITDSLSSPEDLVKNGFPKEVSGKYLWELLENLSESQTLLQINDCLTLNTTVSIENSMKVDGKIRYDEIRIVPINDNQLICIIRDITVTRNLQDEILTKNRELESFAQVIGHEIKNPINIIANYLISMQEEPEAFPEYSDKIIKICRELNAFVNSLLKLARAGKVIGEKEPINIGQLVKNTLVSCTAMHSGIKTEIIANFDSFPEIVGDMNSIQHVIVNLVENSINYRDPEKETLIIETGAFSDGRKTTIFIKDNGLGVEEMTDLIFNPGVTLTKNRGTGFGLAISKKIMEAHGGRIYANSPGDHQGFTVYLEFPGEAVTTQ
ncbi:MAG: PAS domain S-box protein [Firmicutes bacterium]|nr:PAS domain S-box protein [Bacillota bacterium]